MDNVKWKEGMLEKISRFCLMDDTFFNVCMDGSPECVQLILQIIMNNNEALEVQNVVTQRSVENLEYRGVRFDVMATAEGKVYDIEIQRADVGTIPRRARYNSSMLDANVLRSGQDFIELPESYVIFITENDVLKYNLPIYHIDMVIKENNAPFEDGRHIIYVNGDKRDDSALGQLMQDFFSKNPNDMNYEKLKNRTRYFKETEEGVKKMCEIMQEAYNEGKIEGIDEGKIDVILGLLKEGQSLELISRVSRFTIEKIEKVARENDIVILNK